MAITLAPAFLWLIATVGPPAVAGKIVRVPLRSVRRGGARHQYQPPEPVALAGAPKTNGTSEIRRVLQNEFDLIYLLDAEIGTPPQTARLVVDTGSADLWVDVQHYRALDSVTALVFASMPTLSYGQGVVSGVQVKDRVCLQPALCVPQQSVLAATSVLGIGNNGLLDGLLGLSYPGLQKEVGRTFLQEILAAQTFSNLAFGLGLRRQFDPAGSMVTFGDLKELLEDDEVARDSASMKVTLPVLDLDAVAMFWMVRGNVGFSGSATTSAPNTFLGALDSGTSLIAMPSDVYDSTLTSLFNSSNPSDCYHFGTQLLCPCAMKMNSMILSFVGNEGRELHVALTSEDLLEPIDTMRLICRVSIQQGPPSMAFWILGDAFLRRVYVVHDVVGHQVVLFPQQSQMNAAGSVTEGSVTEVIGNNIELNSSATTLSVVAFVLSVFAAVAVFQGRRLRPSAAPSADVYNRL